VKQQRYFFTPKQEKESAKTNIRDYLKEAPVVRRKRRKKSKLPLLRLEKVRKKKRRRKRAKNQSRFSSMKHPLGNLRL